ncbi:phosphoglycolate phosphatase [Ramlibacter tataouinensis]|uniref:phosphoglycolate phosphatase n=1 Tax=Ramlibacter tataouinensis TaxID=94132 RepID=UPI0022F3C536|nr:phosphoglycolate phosphatase [Ramlibacter tataouinensis]WBY03843.1 phosphoglycolate phosphatase [Ramlibacter tataouinensis]
MTSRTGWQAAIVDLDGTLIDTLGDFTVALNGALAELELPALPAAAVERLVGKGSEHLVRSALREAGGEPALYEAAWSAYQRHYARINGRHAAVYAGVRQGLQQLRDAGLRLACVTNKPTGFARELLRQKELLAFFGPVFGGDAFERKKPDPLPLLEACRALGSAPARTLVIGDSSNDAAAARAAGCPVLLVGYGYNHGQPVRAVDADGFLDSLAEIGAWL